MDKKTFEVVGKIRQIAEETGLQRQWIALCTELNRRGIRSSRGSEWTPQGLSNICNRHGLFKSRGEPRPAALATQNTTLAKRGGPEGQASTPQPKLLQPESLQLDVDTIATLREIVAWWRAEGSKMAMQNVTWESEPPEPTYRAVFPGGKDAKANTGIRINKRLLNDALAKAQTPEEMIKTGGSLSPLIERLLWEYLGFNPKYLSRD